MYFYEACLINDMVSQIIGYRWDYVTLYEITYVKLLKVLRVLWDGCSIIISDK